MKLTNSQQAVLDALQEFPREPLPKHAIAARCKPRMNDHAVSARLSELRRFGYDIQKRKAPGKSFYLYYLASPSAPQQMELK